MTSTVTPSTRPSTDSAPGGGGVVLPALAVDLVTDPGLLGHLTPLTRDLEQAGLGALTISDGGLHPVHVAAHLAPLTERIGLLPRTDAVYVEPFHLATQLMSLDHHSGGRAGWLILAETDPTIARSVGRRPLGLAATAREAADVLVAARRVWDSWAADAVVRDVERGVYVDAARLQYADFEGENFSVRGPSITPRSPQGLLPVLVADTDREQLGRTVSEQLADGRVLDVDVSGGAGSDQVAGVITAALSAERAELGAGGATGTVPSSAVRLVRLVGLDLEADPVGVVSSLAADLRGRGLIAPAPDPAGTTAGSLREQLGLAPAPFDLDPARRSDRARHAPQENA